MRRADFDAAWRGCRKDKLETVSFTGLSLDGAGDFSELSISSRIAAFVGVNGVGKTGFLRNINSRLKGRDLNPRIPVSVIGGEFRGRKFVVSADSKAPKDLDVSFVDVSFEVYKIKQFYQRQADLREFLGQFALRKLNTEELGLYKHVIRLPYASVSFREIEAPVSSSIENEESEEDVVFPFFEVSIGGISYDCLSMGLGEFCVCYLLWRLQRSENGAVFLLDEPDSHLSPQSRRALIDAIAYLCNSKKLWVGFSTHTIEMLEPLREPEIFLISSDSLSVAPNIQVAIKRRDAVRQLGLLQSRNLLLVVEDVDSKAAVWAMINKWGKGISGGVDVAIVYEGATDVRSFINKFPKDSQICKAIAILDGDKKPKNSEVPEALFAYLPGLFDPVESARRFAISDCYALSSSIGVEHETLKRALTRLEFVDHHDFFAQLIDELHLEGLRVPDIRVAFMNQWLMSPEVLNEGPQLVERIDGLLDEVRFNKN